MTVAEKLDVSSFIIYRLSRGKMASSHWNSFKYSVVDFQRSAAAVLGTWNFNIPSYVFDMKVSEPDKGGLNMGLSALERNIRSCAQFSTVSLLHHLTIMSHRLFDSFWLFFIESSIRWALKVLVCYLEVLIMNVTFVIELYDIFEIRHLRARLYSPVCIVVKSELFSLLREWLWFFF